MNRYLSLLLLVLILPVYSFAQNSGKEDSFLITKESAGKVEKGMTVDEVLNSYHRSRVKLDIITIEGILIPIAYVYLPFGDKYSPFGASFRLGLGCDGKKNEDFEENFLKNKKWCEGKMEVDRIEVMDSRFKTKEGIGVGSTLKEIQEKYKIKYHAANYDENLQIITEGYGPVFELNKNVFQLNDGWNENLDLISKDLKVISVFW